MVDIDINRIVKGLKKEFGGTTKMSDRRDKGDLVSTGNLSFDLISDGGIPFGVGTELIGWSQSGKSLFCQKIVANAQEKYNAVGIVLDKENAWTPKRCDQLGVNNDMLITSHTADTRTITDAFQFIFKSIDLIKHQDPDAYIVIVIDSIGAFSKDVALGKGEAGRKAKEGKDGYRELFNYMSENIMILVVNHFYYKIGVNFGDPRVAGGGEGWKFFNTVRIALEDRKKIVDPKKGNEVIGNWIGAEVIKTRFGPCYRSCYLQHLYDTGIDYYSGYARLLVDRGYLVPTNKSEFKAFKQHTLMFDNKGEKEKVNENRMDLFLEKHPEMLFTEYPEYNIGDSTEEVIEEEDEYEVELEE